MRVGILGAGWWAEQHAQALATLEGFAVTGVTSGSLESATAFAAQYGGSAYRTAGELLVAPDVDAVLITAPHEYHAPLALQAIASGKPLLLEKPVATNAEDTHAVLNAARAVGVPCLVGFTSHYFPGFSRAKQIIDSGELGRPLSGQSVFQKRWMEANRRDWHLNRERGGGMLLTAGIHALDRLMWLMDAPVQAVSAVIGTHLHDQQADDLASLFLRFAGGGAGMVGSYGYAQGGPINATTILCEAGSLRVTPDSLETGQEDRWTAVPLILPDNLTLAALAQEWLELRAWAESGQLPRVTPEFAGSVMDVVFAAEESARQEREIRLNP
ncbi:Gfo/Idh/MocA family protein [Deinococcus sp. AJ005]|uniref:Gfo/Idh/MocA family protein n=1 Tax=Deinococcus sp. AJ005 TaxID=2652443 RepID=UPI00125CA856|nr:Gfo/Idh/MocA family oxidoreductase [Deinococcus sp. AJ005]QFP76675.1 Gfo/Idh/MocA family oxidoreductase [Deinococcus sp. AJ005]